MKLNIDPVIFSIGPFSLRYYSLMFVIGFVSMGKYVSSLFQRNGRNPEEVSSLTTHIIVGMLIGARLAHCLFYDPAYYFSHPIEILYVWEGGLASHGGYAGVLVAVAIFLRKHRDLSFLWLMDAIAGPCLFVGGLIRIGNFMNSEIYGRPSEVPWAIVFEKVDQLPRHPSQLYEAIGYFIIALILMLNFKRSRERTKNGSNLWTAIILSFTFRFFIEFTKDEQSSLLTAPAINMGQWLSLFFIIAGLILFIRQRRLTRGRLERPMNVIGQ